MSSGTNYTNTGKQVMIEGVKYELVTQLAAAGNANADANDRKIYYD